MKRPLTLMFAFTMLALPIACGDDDEDGEGGTGGATTGGSTAKGGSTTGGKASGGTAGKATGGTPTMAGAGGDTGEAGAGPTPEGGTAGAGEEPSEGGAGGAAGGGTVPSEGGSAGATGTPEGGTAGVGEPSEGGTAGAGEPTAEELIDMFCAKRPGGDECVCPDPPEDCVDCETRTSSEFIGILADCAEDSSAESTAVLTCLAAADEDELICTPPSTADLGTTCTAEQCAFYIKCFGLTEDDVANDLPECVD